MNRPCDCQRLIRGADPLSRGLLRRPPVEFGCHSLKLFTTRSIPCFIVSAPKFRAGPLAMCDAQVCEQLAAVNRCQRFDRLDLYDHGLLNDQVGSIGAVDVNALVQQRQFLLRFKLQSRRHQFVTEASKVGLLENSRSDCPVNADRYSTMVDVMRLIALAGSLCVMPQEMRTPCRVHHSRPVAVREIVPR